jgi:Protein of unknown function (DUF2510)
MIVLTALCLSLVVALPLLVLVLVIARSGRSRPPVPSLPPVGPQWAADPTGRHEFRYWNGTRWTAQVANDGVVVFELACDPRAIGAAK